LLYQAPTGTQDILPEDQPYWRYVVGGMRRVAESYGFEEIDVPIFEATALFARGIGEGTDIVEKEMYTFEDRGGRSLTLRPEFTAGVMRAYVEHGMRAFTISLQGGMPGYEGAINSAFTPDGELRPSYMQRAARVIRAADRASAAIILCCCYQRQDQILKDAQAVRRAVVATAQWVRDNGFANVLLEIANEYPHGGFDHKVLKTADGIAELIGLARDAAPGLLVSASGIGDGRCHRAVCEAADFILIHFNGTPVEQIASRVKALRRYDKAIVCNEDDKPGRQGARAAEASVAAGCSWGLMLSKVNQYVPFEFKGRRDDPVIYAKLRELTAPRPGRN